MFARPGACLALAAALGAAPPTLRACGYHDPSSVSLGMLNWSYPDALHVRTAVWTAQHRGVLARTEETIEPGSAAHVLQQMQRFRATEAQLRAFQARLARALDGRAAPPLAMVLIGSMLWTRFETVDGSPGIAVHVDGPRSGDVVVVTDAPVVEAIAAGRLAPRDALGQGLLRLYGDAQDVKQVGAILAAFEESTQLGSMVR